MGGTLHHPGGPFCQLWGDEIIYIKNIYIILLLLFIYIYMYVYIYVYMAALRLSSAGTAG